MNWEKDEVELLQKHYSCSTIKGIMSIIPFRTSSAIDQKAQKEGLVRIYDDENQIKNLHNMLALITALDHKHKNVKIQSYTEETEESPAHITFEFKVDESKYYKHEVYTITEESIYLTNKNESLSPSDYQNLYTFTYLLLLELFLETRESLNVKKLVDEIGISYGLIGYIRRRERKLTNEVIEKLIPVMTKYGFWNSPITG